MTNSITDKVTEDITNEVVRALQILLHNGKEFDYLVSKADNKTFKLKLEEVTNEYSYR